MNNTTFDVYTYYKSLHPSTLFLFRIANTYEAYFDDAETTASIIPGVHLETDGNTLLKVVLNCENILDICGTLSEHGCECKLIQSRGKGGDFALPDINMVIQDKENDY